MANQNAQPTTPSSQPAVVSGPEANQPAQNILEDVCVIEGEKVEATTMIERPPLGETREIALESGHNYIFGFDKAVTDSFVEENGDLTITFDCGGKLVLKNYSAASSGDDASTFAFSDVIPLGELASLIKVVDTTNEQVEEPETATRKGEKHAEGDSNDTQNVAQIQPAAGDESAAQRLAQIQPAAGEGGTQNSGYGFNTTYTAEAVGPLSPVGVIGATELAYGANFREPNPLIDEDRESNPLLIGPNAEFVDETNLSGGPIVETGQINIDYGSDGPGSIGPNGDFFLSGSAANNVLTSNGDAVVVSQTATGYVGIANGVTVFTLDFQSPSGEYTFTLFQPLDHADGNDANDQIGLTFGVIAFDGDGDSVQTSMTVVVADDAPAIEGDGAKTVDEDDLSPASVSGNLVENFGSDGPGNIHPNGTSSATGELEGGVLSSNGVPVVITATANGYVGMAGATEVFNITINPATGAYTFNLLQSLDHSAPGNNVTNDTISLNFGAEIVDYDGDRANTTITINVIDDVPHINDDQPGIGKGLENIDETNLGPITVNGALDVDFGKDLPSSIAPDGNTSTSGSMTGGNLTSHGVPVVITQTATGYVGTAGGTTVFTFTINPNTGAYSFTLNEQLDHADGSNPNDIITLKFGVRVTDGDGDSDNGSVTINIADDVPTIQGDGLKAIAEADLDNGPVAVNGNLVEDFGEDGPGAINPNGQTTLPNNLTSDGHAVTVTATPNGYVGTANGQNVFTLTIDPSTGAYTFTLIQALDHPANVNTIDLGFGVKITDYDGDSATTMISVRISDDVPTLPGNDNPAVGHGLETVDETNLGPIVVKGDVAIDFGGDGPGGFGGTGAFTFNGSAANGALTSHGVPVSVTMGQTIDTIPGYFIYSGVANGVPVFELKIFNDGHYEYTQLGVLDHADASNPNDLIQLQFGVRAEDADGDAANGLIRINVLDDGPVAVDDGVFTTGNVLQGNVLNNDDAGSDGLGSVVSVVYNGAVINIATGSTVVINGQYGVLSISSNGVYQYTPNGNSDGVDIFKYTMDDFDKDRSSAHLTIRVDNDDNPILIKPATEVVDETNLGPIVETGTVVGDFGTDGPGSFATDGNFASSGSKTGGNLTSDGFPVVVTSTATGYVGTANGQNVFTLTINPTTGAYTFTLFGPLDHADGSNPNDIITLDFGIKGTDNDGDTAFTTITVNVLDDIPTINGDGTKVLAESGLPNASVSGDLVEDFGSDGPGNIQPNGITSANGSLLNGVLSSNGAAVAITQTADGYVGTANGQNVFTLTINPLTGAYTFTLLKPLDHALQGNAINLLFGATIVDGDGDGAKGVITIQITDDTPTLPGNDNPAIGNGLEVVDETNLGPITVGGTVPTDFGGDGPGYIGGTNAFSFSGSAKNNSLTSNGAPVTVDMSQTIDSNPGFFLYTGRANGVVIFTLMLNQKTGAYEFKLFETLDHANVNDPNDLIQLQFGIDIHDADGDVANGLIRINVLDDGPVAVDDVLATTGGTLTGNVLTNDDPGSDGHGGVQSVVFNNVTTNVPANGTVNIVGTYGTLTISSNGAYTYVPKGGSDGIDVFTYKMVDGDGDPATANLRIGVDNDDNPILIKPATEVVDETNLGPIVETGVVQGNFFNDGPGTFSTDGNFSSSGSKTGGNLTSHGEPVIVTSTPTGYIGKVGGGDSVRVIFNLEINPQTGAYEFRLLDTLDHADGSNPNDIITLDFGIKGTDTDGDNAFTTITVNVLDDNPAITGDGVKTIDEGNLGPVSVSGNLAEDFGNDGTGSIKPNGTTSASGDLAGGTLKSGGVAVVITATADGYVGKANGQNVFTLTINPTTGAYTFNLIKPLDHSGQGASDITLKFGAQITDYDGDKASTDIIIKVLDDTPTLPGNDNPTVGNGLETVDETNLGPITVNGAVAKDFGNDGPGSLSTTGVFTSTGSKAGGNLTSKGVAIIVTSTETGYVGKANGAEVFKITIDPATGAYSFTLTGTLDHADKNDPNDVIQLQFGIKISDSDGDTANGAIKINVVDDAPVAHDDHNTSNTTVATGNVVTGANGGPGAADHLSNDTTTVNITKITFGNTTIDVPAVGQAIINGANGILKIATNGSYTYTSLTGIADVFTYTLTDGDGDTSTAKLFLDTTPDISVDIIVNNGGDKICIPEDGQGTVPVHATYGGGDGDEVLSLKVTGINTSWVVTAPGWTNQGGGVYVLTLPAGQKVYDGSFTFKPPHNSDVDMTNVKFTATVFDPDSNTSKTDTDTITLQVDAIIDTPNTSVPPDITGETWYVRNQAESVDLKISAKVTDTDGSEVITKITIDLSKDFTNGDGPFHSLDDMGATLNKGFELTENGKPTGVWQINVGAADATSALAGLKLLIPNNMDYWQIHQNRVGGHKANIVVKFYAQEKNLSGGECDLTNNDTVVIKSFNLSFVITPLVLDLNGNGIDIVLADAGVMFDMNNNGTLDKTSWVAASDGMLALDVNHDGIINDQSELFGNSATADNGFAKLGQYDSNGDGKIDSSDAIFESLIVWQDLNQDGISQANEQLKLSDLGIKSINVNANETDQVIGDAYVSHESTFTYEDGTEGQIVDAWFNVIEGDDITAGATLDGTDGRDFIYGTANNDVIIGNAGGIL